MTLLRDNKLVATKFEIRVMNSMYSSLITLMRDYFHKLFPPNYFKTTFIRNSLPGITERNNTDEQRLIKEIPLISLLMNYEPQDATFSGDPFLLNNFFTFRNTHRNGMYKKILYDENDMVYISAMPNRTKHSFEVLVRHSQDLQSINIQGYLKAKLGLNRPLYLNNRVMEIPLPQSLVAGIAACKGFPITTTEEINKFADYIYHLSNGVITYKLHNSSGKYLFFFKYVTNLLFKVTSYDGIDNEKENKVVMWSDMKLSFEVEYDSYMYFICESFQLPPMDEKINELIIDPNELGAAIHWTFNLPVSEQLEDGRKTVITFETLTDINSEIDYTDFKEHTDPKIRLYIERLLTLKIDPNIDLYSRVFRDGNELILGKDYEIDWKLLRLNILNPFLNFNYRVYIYGDITKISDFTKSYESDDRNTSTNNIIVQN